ncbi:A/G-specific adenine glycosylase [Paracoccus pacificus]|uniref:Adenine DNA glycosylase n=1 Tax=Paracoccus pacificus TaxID=1463598 RepID=A0ABW4R203_9RHOB
MRDETVISARLLEWYDRHARDLPWRVGPAERAAGRIPDPYRVWLSEIMLQQTTVAAVAGYFHRFTARWPTVEALAAARDEDVMAEWAGLGYYARARNLLGCARAVAARGGFPTTRETLLTLPGIGPYTAAAISAIAHDSPETVVDGNVERVVARLFAVRTPLPAAKPELVRLAASLTPQRRAGDHAQAMMDLGATICTPRSPACGICPVVDLCRARALGIAAELPARAAKTPKPRREGIVWVGTTPDAALPAAILPAAVLLERRPARGLLGGTLAFPSTGWDGSDQGPPGDADWRELGKVRHVFTHFQLDLTVMAGVLMGQPRRGQLIAQSEFDPAALPSLMRKVWNRAKDQG